MLNMSYCLILALKKALVEQEDLVYGCSYILLVLASLIFYYVTCLKNPGYLGPKHSKLVRNSFSIFRRVIALLVWWLLLITGISKRYIYSVSLNTRNLPNEWSIYFPEIQSKLLSKNIILYQSSHPPPPKKDIHKSNLIISDIKSWPWRSWGHRWRCVRHNTHDARVR